MTTTAVAPTRPPSPAAEDAVRPPPDRWWAAGVVAAVAVAMLLTWPFADAPYNDDWSYAATVRAVLRTGHLRYNGWASASLIAQAYYGAAWCKLVGSSSYLALRLSTAPLALAAVWLIYAVARRAGLRPPFAAFTALLVGTSPLFLPVATSFMTDAPGLFFTFAAVYALARAVAAERTAAAVGWLVAGMVVGGVGGTGRQIVWVVPVVVGPYAAWARGLRRDVPFAVATAVLWVAVLAGAAWAVRWFNRQPMTVPEPSPLSDVRLAVSKPAHYVGAVVGLGLTAVWVTLPALWPVAGGVRGRRRTVAAAAVFAALVGIVLVRHVSAVRSTPARVIAWHKLDPGFLWPYAMAPWTPNTLAPDGVMSGVEIGGGSRPTSLPVAVRVAAAAAVFAVVAGAVVAVAAGVGADPRGVGRRVVAAVARPARGTFAGPALAVFAAVYVALMLPRSARDMTFDRYVLPLMPVVAIPLLLRAQRRGDRRPPAAAWAVLGLYAAYAVAATQDVTALARAREAAGRELLAAGVPRTAIHGGFEFDFVTQLEAAGHHINDPRIRPRWAYRRRTGPTPAVIPVYTLQVDPTTESTRPDPAFPPVSYWSMLPPFRRRMYVGRYVDPWWADPGRAATRPAADHHVEYGLPPAALPPDYDAPDTPVPPQSGNDE